MSWRLNILACETPMIPGICESALINPSASEVSETAIVYQWERSIKRTCLKSREMAIVSPGLNLLKSFSAPLNPFCESTFRTCVTSMSSSAILRVRFRNLPCLNFTLYTPGIRSIFVCEKPAMCMKNSENTNEPINTKEFVCLNILSLPIF